MPPRKAKTKDKTNTLLKCEHCDYTTPRKAFMDDHVRIHTGDRPYRCDECGKGFTQKSNLTKHQIVHGAGYRNEYKCDKCDFFTRYKQSLKMHQNWHDGVKPYACKVCDRTFSQSTHRRTHMKEAHGDERKFQCHLCSKCFKRKEHLDKHIAFHINERNYSCDVCGKKFIEEKHVTIHKLIHGGEETKIHQCDLCPYKSRYKQGLQVHYRIHLGLRPYKCEQCPKAFRTSQTLRIHTHMVHQGLMGKKFHCSHCDYKSANKQSLKKHIDNIHFGIKKEGKQYPCPYCGNIYLSHASLHGHKRKKHHLKLKQEMKNKLQHRLSMIRNSDNQEFHNSKFDATLAVADYRFTNSFHQSLKESFLNSLKKKKPKKESTKISSSKNQVNKTSKQNIPKNKASEKSALKMKTEKSNPKANKQEKSENKVCVKISPTSEVITPKKEQLSPSKMKTTNSSRKKPVHDLLQERIAKKNKQQQFKAAKCLNFSGVIENKEKSLVGNVPNTADDNSKLGYMSGLGLLQKSVDQSSDSTTLSDTESTGFYNININEPVLALGTIQLKVPEVLSSNNSLKTKSAKKSPKSFPKLKAMKVPVKGITKVPSSQKATKEKSSPKNSKSPKPTKRNTNVKSALSVQSGTNSSVIEYEPVDVPSLGPYGNYMVGGNQIIQISPEPGSLIPVSDIKEEQLDESFTEAQGVPINYSMKEYDSLRDLASVYLDKSN